jgi:large subunit ribosomal protein L25
MEGGVINHVCKEITVLSSPESIPEFIEVDMEEIKTKENVRLSSLSLNEGYDFPTNLKEQDPVLVSVLTARGGSLDLDDEIAEAGEEGAEESADVTTEGADEKPAEGNSSEDSGEKSE